MIRLTGTSFVLKHHIRPKVLAINVALDKRSWHIQEQPPNFFFTHKEIFLCPLVSGGEQRPIVFGPIARGYMMLNVSC
jgi:hypothetical protein